MRRDGAYHKAVAANLIFDAKITDILFTVKMCREQYRLDSGIYTPAQFRTFLEKTSTERQETTTVSGAGCSENGCHF